MRRAVVLLGLAACDQVFGLDGRTEPGTDGGGGSNADAISGDVPTNPACLFGEPSQGGVAAMAWFPDAAMEEATRLDAQGYVELGRANGKSAEMLESTDYTLAFVMLPTSYSAMFHPSLSGDGTLLVGSLAHDDLTTYRLGIATRNIQNFNIPVVADLRTETGDAWTLEVADKPSGPTLVTPRRMVISRSQSVTEVVQEMNAWRATSTTLATMFGLGVISYATLTSDGLGLVLIGTTMANPSAQKILLATRESVAEPFVQTIEIFRPLGNGVASAYLAPDCSKLFFLQQGELRWIFR